MKIYKYQVFYEGKLFMEINAPSFDDACKIWFGMDLLELSGRPDERATDIFEVGVAYEFEGDTNEWWEYVKSVEEDELLAEL